MKGNDRAKTQWFLLYILKSWSEIIDRQKRWELRSLYLTEKIWKTYIYIYKYTYRGWKREYDSDPRIN